MPESDVFSDPCEVISALITRNNGVVSIDNNFTYLTKKYYWDKTGFSSAAVF
jgi:hypothetical protein